MRLNSLPSQQEKSLEENTSLLKKDPWTKYEITKKLHETQGTVLNTISAKSNNEHSNTLNLAYSTLSYIQNQRHAQNPSLFSILNNPDEKHIQNPEIFRVLNNSEEVRRGESGPVSNNLL